MPNSKSQPHIWLIGGTWERGEIARIITVAGFFCVVTVTTAMATIAD